MSNYYNLVKKHIFKKYDLLGWGGKSLYYFFMFLGFTSVYGFYNQLQSSNLENQNAEYYYLTLCVVSYFGSNYCKSTIANKRWEATKNISLDSLITLEAVNSLIDELEKSLSSLKSITQWAVGVLTTLLVLVSTLIGNGLFKFIDVSIKVIDDEVIKELSELVITEFNKSGSNFFEIIYGIVGNLFLLLALPIIFGYFSFSSFSF
ncbi:hypothetical protein [Carnobacterium maltaromaticum]|uniref:hypothetical protein n=1 Tax=Carnobacterium maltaromaticum TaxID=2751 RepID=UPI00191BAFCD|nr:hypothetical protein [Carnobacterium maltaromaticum]CAD5898185.1 conserved membrane hypothetical protein [Carnobacterium maltaromaticum]